MNIIKAMPLADGQIVALDSNRNLVAVYSNDLVIDENNSFSLGDAELESWTSNKNNLYLLLKNKDGTFTLQQRQLNDLSAVFEDISVDSTGYLVSNKDSNSLTMAFDKKVKDNKNLNIIKIITKTS